MSFTNFKTVCLATLLLVYAVLAIYLGYVFLDDPSILKALPSLLAAGLVVGLCLLIVLVNPMYRVYKRWFK